MAIRTALIIDPGGILGGDAADELTTLGIAPSVVGSYGLAALQAAFANRPDLALVCIDEPAARPLDLVRRLRDALPDCVVLGALPASNAGLAAEVVAAGAIPWTVGLRRGSLAACVSGISERQDRRKAVGAIQASGGRVITVVGAKGGVGKTTVAINLAVALAQESHGTVALVDADPLFGDVALALNLNPDSGLAEAVTALRQEDPPDLHDLFTPAYGISVLPTRAVHGAGVPVSAAELLDVLDRLRRAYEYIVVDTGGAFCELTSAAARAASNCLLVTTPEPASARDARLCARWLRDECHFSADSRQLQLLVNRAGMKGAFSLEQVAAETGTTVGWAVADDRHLLKAMQAGVPAVERYPRAAGAVALRNLAAWFAGAAPARGNGPSKGDHHRARARLLSWYYGR